MLQTLNLEDERLHSSDAMFSPFTFHPANSTKVSKHWMWCTFDYSRPSVVHQGQETCMDFVLGKSWLLENYRNNIWCYCCDGEKSVSLNPNLDGKYEKLVM